MGGFLFLFGGVATIALIAMAGIRGYGWTRLVLAGATVVWSLTWIGMLLAQRSIPNAGRGVGWWVLLLGVAVVVIGTIVTWISESRAEGVSPAVPAGGGTDGDRYIDSSSHLRARPPDEPTPSSEEVSPESSPPASDPARHRRTPILPQHAQLGLLG